jgi:hypothetical protein
VLLVSEDPVQKFGWVKLCIAPAAASNAFLKKAYTFEIHKSSWALVSRKSLFG